MGDFAQNSSVATLPTLVLKHLSRWKMIFRYLRGMANGTNIGCT